MEVTQDTYERLERISEDRNVDMEEVVEEFKYQFSEIKEKASVEDDLLETLAVRCIWTQNFYNNNSVSSDDKKEMYTKEEIYDIFILRYCHGPKDYDYSEKGIKTLVGKYLNKYEKHKGEEYEEEYPRGAIGSVRRRFEDLISEGSDYHFKNKEWDEIRRIIYERDDYTCFECDGDDVKVHAHHIVPKFADGKDDRRNLITLCEECHSNKHGWME